MRNYLGPMLMGAAIGSIMTFMCIQNDDKIQAMPKKALNFLHNMNADLMGK